MTPTQETEFASLKTAVIESNAKINDLNEQLESKKKEIKKKDAEIKNLRKEISAKDAEIKTLGDLNERQEKKIEEQREKIKNLLNMTQSASLNIEFLKSVLSATIGRHSEEKAGTTEFLALQVVKDSILEVYREKRINTIENLLFYIDRLENFIEITANKPLSEMDKKTIETLMRNIKGLAGIALLEPENF